MNRTIEAVGGSDGIPTEALGKAHGSGHANAFKRLSTTKSDLVLLLTRDIELEQQLAMAAAASGARLIVARTVGVAFEILYQRGRELDLMVIDFDNGPRGMALLCALTVSRIDLPIVALTSTERDHSIVVAYAAGAACCLTKPMNAAELEMVIRLLAERNCYAKQPDQKKPTDSQLTPCNFKHGRQRQINPNANRTRHSAKTLRERASALRKELQA